jgi:isocitrate dehydrogenase (NAD+)
MDRANPTALVLAGVLLLRYLGENAAADALDRAVADVLREGDVLRKGKEVAAELKPTRDDASAVGTSQMIDAIIERMRGR